MSPIVRTNTYQHLNDLAWDVRAKAIELAEAISRGQDAALVDPEKIVNSAFADAAFPFRLVPR